MKHDTLCTKPIWANDTIYNVKPIIALRCICHKGYPNGEPSINKHCTYHRLFVKSYRKQQARIKEKMNG